MRCDWPSLIFNPDIVGGVFGLSFSKAFSTVNGF